MEDAMRAILALLIATTANVACAGELEFSYESFQMTQTGAAELVIKFTNRTGAHLDYAVARCALLDADNKAITTMPVIARDMPVGTIAYAKNYGPRDSRVKHVNCRIER